MPQSHLNKYFLRQLVTWTFPVSMVVRDPYVTVLELSPLPVPFLKLFSMSFAF